MKKYMFALAAVAVIASSPTMANDFTGIRAEVTAGLDSVTNGVDVTDVTYGVGFGADAELYKNVIIGAEVNVDNVFDNYNIGVMTRIGYVVSNKALLYGEIGYANWQQTTSGSLDGFRVGGGIEANIYKSVYAKAEYQYTDFQNGVGQSGGLIGVGYRF